MTHIPSQGATTPVVTGALDSAHIGDIKGALGTIRREDTGRRLTWRAKAMTLLAILGPGLIVMVGDNDAGAFATYTQAGQNYGTSLLWTLLLLVPVLFVNQEMVLRLGAVTGVGHARLILARFGTFWGAFSVIDLFILNGLTIVTEFIGISLAMDYLGVSKIGGVACAAVLTMLAATTGDFRRFERFALMLCLGSLLLVPIVVAVHAPGGQILHDLTIPNLPEGKLSDVLLLIIGIVGTTVAPWQLFFQQSYIIDKRITPAFMTYEKADLWIGILVVMIGAIAMIVFAAATFAGRPEFGHFTDAGGIAEGLGNYVSPTMGMLFALALIDASIIGASAVSLATAYAIGDVLSLNHSLHRKPGEARGFYLVYAGLIGVSAVIVLLPGSPLGLITLAVQTLAGVLLPSATVFLLLLCNDGEVLGPWVNGVWRNAFTSVVIGVLVLLSVVLTASVLYPEISGEQILMILGGGAVLAVVGALATWMLREHSAVEPMARQPLETRRLWRMPPLAALTAPRMTLSKRVWMGVLRLYLVVAVGMVVVRVVQLALAS
jgi:Mn2+/Fe2+ NRAMP family transporter